MNLRLPFRFPLVAFIISLSLFTLISFSTFSQASVLTGYKGMRWVGNIGTATATDSPQTFATYEEAYAYTAAHASDHMTPAGGSYGAYTWASASLEQQSYYNYTQLSGSTYITSWYYTQVFPSPYGSVGGAGTWPTSENDICGNFSADIKESKIGGVGGHYRHGPVNEVALTNTAERSLGGSPCITPIGVTPYWQVHKSWDFSIKEVYDEQIKTGKELGPCPDCGGNPTLSSNPIHLASGNKYKAQTDFVGSGDLPLVIARYYNSNSFGDIGMGNQWRHHYDRYITKAPNSSLNIAYAHRHNGRVLDYTKNVSTGLWVPDADINEILTPVMSGPTQTGWTLTLSDDSVETYNIAGDLLSIKTRAGLTQTLNYDTARRITTVTDDFNHTLTFAYDINSRVSTITNTKGEVFTYTYATNGNLTNITFPAIGGVSKFKTYRYENTAFAFNLTGITDEKGVSFETYTYDANGLAITSEIATGVNKIAVDFSTVGNGASYVTVTDALNVARPVNFTTVLKSRRNAGTTTTPSVDSALKFNNISFDSQGNPATLIDFNNNKTTKTFNSRNLETSRDEGALERCPLGTSFSNSANGTSCTTGTCYNNANPTAPFPGAVLSGGWYFSCATPATILPIRTITTNWHSIYRLPTSIVEPNRTSSYTYDSAGNALTKTITNTVNSATRVWTYTYDSYGRILTEDGPRTDVSDITTYAYYANILGNGNARGLLNTITNAASQVTTYNTYDSNGKPTKITNSNGVVSTFTYNARGWLTAKTLNYGLASAETTSYTYDDTGLLIKVTQPDTSWISSTYDNAHRLVSVADSDGNHINYTLDNLGNKLTEKAYAPANVLKQQASKIYNSLGRLYQAIGASSQTTTYTYDAQGNNTVVADPLTHSTTNTFDSLNRLSQTADANSGIAKYTYDAIDQLTTVTDPRNNSTTYTVDSLGNMTQTVSPDTATSSKTYNAAGLVATTTDARAKVATFTYDMLNRVSNIAYPDQTIAFSYDSGAYGKGRLTGLTDGTGSTSWAYDAFGRVVSKNQIITNTPINSSLTLGYTYVNGNLTEIAYPSGKTVKYEYTGGKVSAVKLKGIAPNPDVVIASSITYWPFGSAKSWTWGNATSYSRSFDADGRLTGFPLAGITKIIAYDAASRITGISESNTAKSFAYGYDVIDRLTGSTVGAGGSTLLNQTWALDSNGNRTTHVNGGTTFTYTNPTTSNKTSAVSGLKTYTYDAAGNITSDGVNALVYDDRGRLKSFGSVNYKINGLGQRLQKDSSGSKVRFMYNENGNLMGEYDGSDATLIEHVWLNGQIIGAMKPNAGATDMFYVYTDQIGAPRAITTNAGTPTIVWTWDNNDPFGANTANAISLTYNVRLPGQYFDSESGMHYNYFRDYDPAVGRYATSDPIGLKGGLNTFGYVGGKSLRLVDLDGTSGKDVGSIEAIFRMTIDRLVACKCRLEGNGWSNAYMNNFIAMYIDDNLMECYPQAAMVQKDMDANKSKFDDKWIFTIVSKPGHYWLEARSSNNKDPVLVLDPWVDKFQRLPPGSKPTGITVSSTPEYEACKCKKQN